MMHHERKIDAHGPAKGPPGRVPTYFNQECPICGRPLQVPVEHLGRPVACGHCRGRFDAIDPASNVARQASLIDRVERLLL